MRSKNAYHFIDNLMMPLCPARYAFLKPDPRDCRRQRRCSLRVCQQPFPRIASSAFVDLQMSRSVWSQSRCCMSVDELEVYHEDDGGFSWIVVGSSEALQLLRSSKIYPMTDGIIASILENEEGWSRVSRRDR